MLPVLQLKKETYQYNLKIGIYSEKILLLLIIKNLKTYMLYCKGNGDQIVAYFNTYVIVKYGKSNMKDIYSFAFNTR